MLRRRWTPWVLLLLSVLFSASPAHAQRSNRSDAAADVGVVLDMGTLVGKMCWASMSLAADDFYAAHPTYSTRLVLHLRDGQAEVVGAGSAALGLLKNDGVLAILGPQKSAQARFLSDIANKTQVPVISFTATSPSLSSSAEPYFVRAALNDSSQVNAVVSIVKAYGWREVVPIYEDTDFGSGVIPHLIIAMDAINVRVPHRTVISPSATDDQIMEELYKLKTMQTRVFIVHMSLAVGTRLFSQANVGGMVSKGYAWILTDGIASLVDSIDPTVIGTMQGFLGVRPYVARTPQLDAFTLRWKKKYHSEYPDQAGKAELSISGVWAYDAVQALALAIEKVGAANFTFEKPVVLSNSTDLDTLVVSRKGPELLRAVVQTRFTGLGGEFWLVDGQLQSSAFQIVNVNGNGHREIGYWTPRYGISRQVKPTAPGKEYATSKEDLATVVWPGDSTEVPRGWEIPSNGKKLKVGVPVKQWFLEFVKVEEGPANKVPNPRGYCIDIFDEVMRSLPYPVPFEYIPYNVGTHGHASHSYTELVKQVALGKFDAVAGDVTILADRFQYVDFTLPYTESGVYMIVPLTADKKRSAWIFLKPLTAELWLSSVGFFILTGFVVWAIERQCHNEHFRGSPLKVISNVLYFTFSTLVFAQRQELQSSLSKAVVIVWVFVVLILTSSYTASLSSRLTVEQLQPVVTDVDQLIKDGACVGYSEGSFLGELLKPTFGESRLVPLGGPDKYAKALSNGAVAAVFHELPYAKLFLKEYCSGYTIIGPTHRTAGLGFVFPKDSPLLSDVSAAVLKVTQSPGMKDIERKWMETNSTCRGQDGGAVPSSDKLTFYSLRGLFLVTGVTSISALLISCVVCLYDYCLSRQVVVPSLPGESDGVPLQVPSSHEDQSQGASSGGFLVPTTEEATQQRHGEGDLPAGSSGRLPHAIEQEMAVMIPVQATE